MKVMGAAAGTGASLDEVYDLGVAFAAHIVSIAATLDHCHVPGRKEHGTLEPNVMEIGTGPHNEPGYKKVSPVPEASELVSTLLKHCLDESDPERRNILADIHELGCAYESLPQIPGKDYRSKMTAMKQSIRKVEMLGYGIVVRGSERPKGWIPDMSDAMQHEPASP